MESATTRDNTVAQIWRDHELKTWRVDTFKISPEPQFAEKLVEPGPPGSLFSAMRRQRVAATARLDRDVGAWRGQADSSRSASDGRWTLTGVPCSQSGTDPVLGTMA